MRLRSRGTSSSTYERTDDPERRAAWDGHLGKGGPGVVIRAARAGDIVVDDAEARQVA